MKRDYFISVAMATYNGEKYIKKQLDSILVQLKDNDEIIVSDDGSKDKTLEIIRNYNDVRIKIIEGPKNGVKQNFANAIAHCNGKYIFLSDQDDIWLDNKVEKVLEVFEKEDCLCVIHDNITFDSSSNDIILDSFFEYRGSKSGILKNMLKNSYIGCCMAFDSTMKNIILPIPNDIEMHDQWIGILCEKYGKSIFLKDKLIKYRRHDSNESDCFKHHKLKKMITNRIVFLRRYMGR